MTWGPLEQDHLCGSQVWPLGQQWTPSLQQTAWVAEEGNISQCGTVCFSWINVLQSWSYRGQRAAAPLLGLFHEAAGCILGAAGIGVTHFPGKLSWKWYSPRGLPLQGRYFQQPGQSQTTGFITRLLSHVTLVAFGAAVLLVTAAHGLQRRDFIQEQSSVPDTYEQTCLSRTKLFSSIKKETKQTFSINDFTSVSNKGSQNTDLR